MSPYDAAIAATRVFSLEFQFDTTDSNGNLQRGKYNQWALKDYDYFHAQVEAQTAAGNHLSASCDWVRDGQTTVTIESDLPATQLQYVLEHVRTALNPPPDTQPTTAP